MIRLTRINHVPLVLNSDLIEHIEVTPDTVISMTNGQKFVVLETPDEVVKLVIEFRRLINDRFDKQLEDQQHNEDTLTGEAGLAGKQEQVID